MNYESIGNVIDLLRWLQLQDLERPTCELIAELVFGDGDRWGDSGAILKVAARFVDELETAAVIVQNSEYLTEEQKIGIYKSIMYLTEVFRARGLYTSHPSHQSHVPITISALTAFRISRPDEAIKHARDLAQDVDDLIQKIDGLGLHATVAARARQHLAVLSTMLRHIGVFGIESAMATYDELIIRLGRTEGANQKPRPSSALTKLFAVVQTWSTRIAAIEKLWSAGSKMIDHVGGAQNLLSQLPRL